MDPVSLVASIKAGISAGKAISSLSKQIGQFFDGADQAKKNHSNKMDKKFVSVNQEALSTWSDKILYEEQERELQEWVSNTYGRSKWLELIKIRKEVLVERREQEARARRAAQARQEMTLTVVSILVLLLGALVGSTWYLQHLGWVDVRDLFR
tara:strand:+ start:950 stop:1408 length:459 start_codon:yes stop_codon:yes gene_type:complete